MSFREGCEGGREQSWREQGGQARGAGGEPGRGRHVG